MATGLVARTWTTAFRVSPVDNVPKSNSPISKVPKLPDVPAIFSWARGWMRARAGADLSDPRGTGLAPETSNN
jgi:hypothetical protein